MFRKHDFPQDWLRISDSEAKKHLQYLLEHYQHYEISAFGDDYIEIAGIGFSRHLDGTKYGRFLYPFPCYYVNHQKMYNDENREMYLLCKKIFDACEQELKTRKSQVKIKEEKRKSRENVFLYITVGCFSVIMVVAMIGNMKSQKQQEKIDNQVKKYEESLPNHDEYEDTKLQIEHYRDSLIHTRTK